MGELPRLCFVLKDEFGGEMECVYDLTPFLKFFAQYAEDLPTKKYKALTDKLVAEKGVPAEEAREWAKKLIKIENQMVAEACLRHLQEGLQPALQEALNTQLLIAANLAATIVSDLQDGTKKASNDLLEKQKRQAQSRLRTGQGRFSDPVAFQLRVTLAMEIANTKGWPITQEKIAELLGFSDRGFRKQLQTYGFKWENIVRKFRTGTKSG